MPHPSRVLQSLLPAATLAVSGFLALGCGGALVPTAGGANSFVRGGTMAGVIHGGNQPVSGSTVALYAAGNSGYGSTAVAYAVATSLPNGGFSFTQLTPGSTPPTGPITPLTSTYTCPTGSTTNYDPQMFLVAKGGETQGVGNGSNSAAAFIFALGKCSTASSAVVDMNEVTSVATMAALQQYFNPASESFGYPNSTQGTLGFANGVALISNLINTASGDAVTSKSLAATPLGTSNSVTVAAQPETSKINLLANILAACVNNTSNTATGCSTLFSSAVPPLASVTSQTTQSFSSITATNEDTVQALYFMLTNPTSGNSATNMNALFGLPSGYSPFQPTLATAPTDWTVSIYYTSTNTCTLLAGAGTTGGARFLNGVNNPTIDAAGNVWSANIGGNGDLFAITPNGTPYSCGIGTDAPSAAGLTIDPAGYVWVAAGAKVGSNYNLIKWNPSTGLEDSTWFASTTAVPQAIVADGHNNIFYTVSTNAAAFDTTSGSLNEFAGAGVAGTTNSTITTQKIATLFSLPQFMAVDSSDNVWVAIQNVGTPTAQGLFEVYPSNNTSGTTYMAGTSDGSHSGFEAANIANLAANLVGGKPLIYSPYAVAVGPNGTIYSSNGAGSGSSGYSYRWTTITPSAPGVAAVTDSAVNLAGNFSVRGLAVDGAGNQWQANTSAATGNWVTGATSSGLYSLSEVSAAGNALSATSASGTGAYGVDTGSFQKSNLPNPPRGVAIDPTGNVWVGANTSSGTGILELVGAAVPVVTPLSVAAANGTLAAKP